MSLQDVLFKFAEYIATVDSQACLKVSVPKDSKDSTLLARLFWEIDAKLDYSVRYAPRHGMTRERVCKLVDSCAPTAPHSEYTCWVNWCPQIIKSSGDKVIVLQETDDGHIYVATNY